MKNLEKKHKIILVTMILGILVLFGGLTFAFFSSNATGEKKLVKVTAGTMQLKFSDVGESKGIVRSLNPGESISKILTIENTGTLDASAIIYWDDLVNTYMTGSLTYKLSRSDSENGTYREIESYSNNVPHSEKSSTRPLSKVITLAPNEKVYYKVEIKLENLEDVDQNADAGAQLSTRFTLISVPNDGSIAMIADTAILTYGIEGEEQGITSIAPGDTATRTLKLQSTDTEDTTTTLYWDDLVNTYSEGQVSFTLSESSSKDGEYTEVSLTDNKVPVSSTPTRKELSEEITLNPKEEKYYRVDVTLDASADSTGKELNTEFTIDDAVKSTIEPTPRETVVEKIIASVNDGTPDFSKVATTDEGIFAMEDEDGTSYYFRGAVENNYVKFGKYGDVYRGYDTEAKTSDFADYDTLEACQSATTYNNICEPMQGKDMYWRIIRVNGNESLRMIYDGTSAHSNGEFSKDRVALMRIAYNTSQHDAKHVGYMYGGLSVLASGSKVQAQTNETNSNIKIQLESWYEQNIANTSYGEYVSNEVFCNDRSTPDSSYALGYAKNQTYYGARVRLDTNKMPTFKCNMNNTISTKNDKFTAPGNDKGNEKLKYPVGLITADEISAAGSGYESSNKSSNYYLYKGLNYWSFSPNSSYSTAWAFCEQYGYISSASMLVKGNVAPVINLSVEAANLLVGSGTMTDPYRIEE